jgi:hypothetical protein
MTSHVHRLRLVVAQSGRAARVSFLGACVGWTLESPMTMARCRVGADFGPVVEKSRLRCGEMGQRVFARVVDLCGCLDGPFDRRWALRDLVRWELGLSVGLMSLAQCRLVAILVEVRLS